MWAVGLEFGTRGAGSEFGRSALACGVSGT